MGTFDKKNRLYIIFLLLISILLIITRVLFFQPFGDEQENITAGWLINQGNIPYRDFFFHHLPLPFYLNAFLQLLPFNIEITSRLFVLAFYFISFLILINISNKKLKPSLLLTFLLITLFSKDLNSFMFLADNFSAISFLVIILAFLNYSNNKKFELKKLTIIFGIYGFISIWSSFTSIIPLGFLTLGFIIWQRKRLFKEFAKLDKKYFLILSLHLIFPIYFLITKSFSDFWWSNFTYNSKYYFTLRLAENNTELQYGVIYRIFNQFFKYTVREGGYLFANIVIFLKTFKNLFLNIYKINFFFQGSWIAISSFFDSISRLKSIAFIVFLILSIRLIKQLKFKYLCILFLFIFIRSRSNETFHLNIFYYFIFWLISYLTYNSWQSKKYFSSVINTAILLIFINLGVTNLRVLIKNKENFTSSKVTQIANQLEKGDKVLLLGGDTYIYKLSQAQLSSKYFYYHPWFHNVHPITDNIKQTIENQKADKIITQELDHIDEYQDHYLYDLLPLIELNYQYQGNYIWTKIDNI